MIGYKNTFTGLVCHFFVPLFSFLLYFSGVFVCSEMGAGPKKHTTEANQCKSMQKKEEDWSKTLRKVEPGAHHSLTVNSLKLEAFRSTIGECSIDGRRPRSFYRESTKINETLPMRSSSGPKFISSSNAGFKKPSISATILLRYFLLDICILKLYSSDFVFRCAMFHYCCQVF